MLEKKKISLECHNGIKYVEKKKISLECHSGIKCIGK